MRRAAVVVVALGLGSCARDSVIFYETTRTRTVECDIRSTGEFCAEPEQFDAPVIDVWAVEVTKQIARLYVDEEVWVLDPLAEGEDPFAVERTASKASSIASGAGPCTTTTTRFVQFRADGANLDGQLQTQTILEGPEACGSTPVGERTTDNLSGVAGGP
ncbi:MAG: hypothetical protein Q8O67_06950 [Deltaproteobacteria bacterium]|nr:hypothetical protein [Deltaproteobacteria bacterium]